MINAATVSNGPVTVTTPDHQSLQFKHFIYGCSRTWSSSDLRALEDMASAEGVGNAGYKNATSIYDFTVTDIDGNQVSLEKYRNHVCIIVNVASKCGYTHVNYTQLVDLYDRFESKGLKILAFPCNQFMSQEPGNSEEIKCFISGYKGDGKFDVFSKINVNGEDAHPLWKYLKEKQGGLLIDAIKWNFTKFVINKQGQPVERCAANVNPFDMEKTIVKYLNE